MSRLPRHLEHLKAAFAAEAVSAARFRAYAARAQADGYPNLARHWLELAAAKDALAERQLEAAGQVRGGALDLGAALAEESYENEILYPKMIRDVDDADAAAVLEQALAAQRDHLAKLNRLREAFESAPGDVPA